MPTNAVAPADAPAAELYPYLTATQMGQLSSFGTRDTVIGGQVLYEPGDRGVALYVLVTAAVDILHPGAHEDRHVTSLEPGMFTGEAGMIGGQRAVVRARVRTGGEVIRIEPKELRILVAQDAEMSGLLLSAFILRRFMLVTREMGNVTCRIRALPRDGSPA